MHLQYEQGPGVLVIDDEDMVRVITIKLLQLDGYNAVGAASGHEGLDMLAGQHGFSAVLLDASMPQMSGQEALRRLRMTDPVIPVVFMSGLLVDQVQEDEKQQAFSCFLKKPFTRSQLSAAMRSILPTRAPPRRSFVEQSHPE